MKEAKLLTEARNENEDNSPGLTSAKKKKTPTKRTDPQDKSDAKKSIAPVHNAKKRKRAAARPKTEEDLDELPHNLGKAFIMKSADPQETKPEGDNESTSKRRATRNTTIKADEIKELTQTVQEATIEMQENPTASVSRKRRTNAYGLTPGVSPFPEWPHPTPEECQEVVNLLSQVHGPQIAPQTIPLPSLTVSGCGEVPSILDAMIRTLLSAATTGTNSSRAFQGLVDKFGILKEGIGKGSVDWDAVRRAKQQDIFEAIKSGGLASNKSKNIKAILEKVYEENMARRDALVQAQEVQDATLAPKDDPNESSRQQLTEITRTDQHVLSLDYLHALPTREAMEAMMQYPGIGVKTASCVALFCMRRPSLAVDTHVFRLLKWLHWVPPTVKGEIAAFSHVEVRVPDEMKYALHQLFIKHGKTCPRCRAATGETSEDWDKGCIIDHLVTRTGKRKGGIGPVLGKQVKHGKANTAKAKKADGSAKKSAKENDSDSDSLSSLSSAEFMPGDQL
jgi:amidophosphoribosyltransferase